MWWQWLTCCLNFTVENVVIIIVVVVLSSHALRGTPITLARDLNATSCFTRTNQSLSVFYLTIFHKISVLESNLQSNFKFNIKVYSQTWLSGI